MMLKKTISRLRSAKALLALAQLVRDPTKLGQVFEMADALAEPEVIAHVVRKISAESPVVDRALDERHRLKVDLASLRKLPEGTLGRIFADDMTAAGLDPAALPFLPSPNRDAFFRAHLYETHDVWHAVTGFETDIYGEIGLQAFYQAQIGDGLSSLLLATGLLRIALYDRDSGRRMMDEIVRGYAMGKSAKPFFGVHWDELWDVSLDEVRTRLGIAVDAPAASTRLAA